MAGSAGYGKGRQSLKTPIFDDRTSEIVGKIIRADYQSTRRVIRPNFSLATAHIVSVNGATGGAPGVRTEDCS